MPVNDTRIDETEWSGLGEIVINWSGLNEIGSSSRVCLRTNPTLLQPAGNWNDKHLHLAMSAVGEEGWLGDGFMGFPRVHRSQILITTVIFSYSPVSAFIVQWPQILTMRQKQYVMF